MVSCLVWAVNHIINVLIEKKCIVKSCASNWQTYHITLYTCHRREDITYIEVVLMWYGVNVHDFTMHFFSIKTLMIWFTAHTAFTDGNGLSCLYVLCLLYNCQGKGMTVVTWKWNQSN
jgi:hypothetical protein